MKVTLSLPANVQLISQAQIISSRHPQFKGKPSVIGISTVDHQLAVQYRTYIRYSHSLNALTSILDDEQFSSSGDIFWHT